MAAPTSDDLALGLDAAQHAAVFSEAAPLCLLAGAGAGKTRVLTRRLARRILDGSVEPEHAMVLTFTRKAAGELRDRLRGLGIDRSITVGTFHAVAFAQLRRRWLDQGRAAPQVASNPIRIVEAAIESLNWERSLKARQVAVELAWAKSHNLTPDSYENGLRRLGHRSAISPQQIAKIYSAYESEKRKRRVVDYDDLLSLMTAAITDDRAFAAAQHWKFRHFFVDEFQDLNYAQFALLRAWLGDRNDLFVVGDANQAIYGWNGADSSFLTEIERNLAGVQTLRLDVNYRSTPEVLNAAAAVLGEKRATGVGESNGIKPVVVKHVDEVDEATGIARRVRRLHGEGYRWSDIAVLVRTNAQRLVFEKAFAKYAVPFAPAGGSAWMREEAVIEAVEMIRQTPQLRLAQCAPDFDNADLRKAISECLADDPDMTVGDFLSWIDIASRNDGPEVAGGVVITTFHRAKGLEWPAVFLAGVEDGLVPYGGEDSPQVDEERRLFYVAITRSRERLILSWAAEREAKDRLPSPWLTKIESAEASEPELDIASIHEMIEEGRSELDAGGAPENNARRDIEHWRLARAKLTGVEPRLILSDRVIDAIIELNPTTREELAQVEGFGAVRASSIGDEILDALRAN